VEVITGVFDGRTFLNELMNARQNSYYKMLHAVRSACEAQTAVWADFPAFADSYAVFKLRYDEVKDAISDQLQKTFAATGQKESLREKLTPLAMRIARALQYYATINANEDLLADARTRESELKVMGEKAFVGHVSKLLSLVGGIPIAQLSPYGLTAAQVADASATLSAFTATMGQPQHCRTKAAAGTKRLAALLAEIRTLLNTRLDLAAEMMEDEHPEFYREYKICRVIIDPGYRKRALHVKVRSAETGQPLPGVTAILSPGDIRKKSGPSGSFHMNRLEAGKYTIKLLHDKHQEYTGTIRVGKNEGTVVELEMVGGAVTL
jgi:hypothetical protein